MVARVNDGVAAPPQIAKPSSRRRHLAALCGRQTVARVQPTDEVTAGFDLTTEAVNAVENDIRRRIATNALTWGAEELAAAVDQLQQIGQFAASVEVLRSEWLVLRGAGDPDPDTSDGLHVRLQRGQRTPEDAFRVPVLQSLVELGGTAPLHDVLDRVGDKMAGVLNDADREHLPSNHRVVRWRNTAQWCRNTLVREGLIAGVSQRGVWEITQSGRDLVAQITP